MPGSSAARGLPGEIRLQETLLVAKEALEVDVFRHGARPRRRRTSDVGAGGRGVVGTRAPLATGSRGCRGAWFLNLVIARLGELVDGVEDCPRIHRVAHVADAAVISVIGCVSPRTYLTTTRVRRSVLRASYEVGIARNPVRSTIRLLCFARGWVDQPDYNLAPPSPSISPFSHRVVTDLMLACDGGDRQRAVPALRLNRSPIDRFGSAVHRLIVVMRVRNACMFG